MRARPAAGGSGRRSDLLRGRDESLLRRFPSRKERCCSTVALASKLVQALNVPVLQLVNSQWKWLVFFFFAIPCLRLPSRLSKCPRLPFVVVSCCVRFVWNRRWRSSWRKCLPSTASSSRPLTFLAFLVVSWIMEVFRVEQIADTPVPGYGVFGDHQGSLPGESPVQLTAEQKGESRSSHTCWWRSSRFSPRMRLFTSVLTSRTWTFESSRLRKTLEIFEVFTPVGVQQRLVDAGLLERFQRSLTLLGEMAGSNPWQLMLS